MTPPCDERESLSSVTSPSPHSSHGREHPLTVVLTWCCLLHLGRGWALLDFPFLHFASKADDTVVWKALLLLIERGQITWGEGKREKVAFFFSFLFLFQDFWSRVAAHQQKPVHGEGQSPPVCDGRGKPHGVSSPEVHHWHQNQFKVSDVPTYHCPNWAAWHGMKVHLLEFWHSLVQAARRTGSSSWAWHRGNTRHLLTASPRICSFSKPV